MIFKKASSIFSKTTKEMVQMNNAYKDMKSNNNINSAEIRNSLKTKSEKFQDRKKGKDNMYDIIRNK
ncbi:hypothetical protein COK91_28425 [Bacillus cereus]|uniref:hypothetical protein n=1 Tax=Bacillus cereus TaxID=1396 RepID=UPI000BF29478|nr:hypothetical protein [Bacillus cereus]PFU78030.1 hypothetical protein COK91_28425 [Bacillus cereus]